VLERGKKGQVYNIGGGSEKKNFEIARAILVRLSLPETLIQFVEDRPGHDYRYSVDCTKIHSLGWKPEVTFGEGLQRTLDWYSINRWWWRRLVH
jgi:dTDP-glucose 4,6-dehydratase